MSPYLYFKGRVTNYGELLDFFKIPKSHSHYSDIQKGSNGVIKEGHPVIYHPGDWDETKGTLHTVDTIQIKTNTGNHSLSWDTKFIVIDIKPIINQLEL